jgi:peptide/nickel transport system substrate-binding protein
MTMGLRRVIAMVGASLAALAMPAGAQSLRFAASAPLLTMDPHATNDFVTQMVMTQIYETLVRVDADLTLQPGLALSWEHRGGLVWRFKLRPGVRFHDGTALAASDIVFSIERARAGRFWSAFAGPIDRIEIVDPETIDVVTKAPDPLLPRKMSRLQIMSEVWARKHGAEKAHDLAATGGDFHAQRNANGTGIMMLRSHDTQRTVMARNPQWWGQTTSNVAEAVFTQIAAAPTRVAALLSGEIDLVTDLPLQDIERVRAAQGMKVEQAPQLLFMELEMDGTREEGNAMWDKQGVPLPRNPFRDLRVRRAFAHAIDAQAIVQRIMRGNG